MAIGFYGWVLSTLISPALAGDTPLSVDVSGARSDQGVIACQLFSAETGFPNDTTHAIARDVRPVKGGTATCTFPDVPAGQVAVAVLHDENGNLTLDSAWYGAPIEGYGFSNGAAGHVFSPARFDEAAIEVSAPGTIHVALAY